MHSLRVLVTFDILEDRTSRGFFAYEDSRLWKRLVLEGGPAAFHRCVVVAVADGAHGGLEAVIGELLEIRMVGGVSLNDETEVSRSHRLPLEVQR